MKTKKIGLYGGFHNVSEIKVVVPVESAESLKQGYSTLQDVLTPGQLKRVQKHFCGMDDCCCGGIHRGVEVIFY